MYEHLIKILSGNATEIIVNFVSVFLGAFLAYIMAISMEKKKKKERLKVVVPILKNDLEKNLRDLEGIELFAGNLERISKNYKKTDNPDDKLKFQQQIESLNNRIQTRLKINTGTYMSLINDILLLKTETALKITKCYNHVEYTKIQLQQAFQEDNLKTKLDEYEAKRQTIKEELNNIIANLKY